MTLEIKDERVYWLWLREILGVGSNKVCEVLEYFGSPKAVYEKDDATLLKSDLFSKTHLLRKKNVSLKKLIEDLNYCDKNNIRVVTFFNEEYPLCLKNIEAPPICIFVRGIDLNNIFPSFAIVGSRKPTELGEKAAFSLAAKLSLAGFTIVSGGALGIDKMAHLGALAAGGKTVLVLGCGIDSDYLKANKELRNAAEVNGTIISEFLPKAPATKYTFPIRNRIISALCSGVAVIEAGQKSGALITASYAMEQGREIFAVPGDISKEEYKGNNQLIKDGATPITNIDDILSVYSGRFGDVLNFDVRLTNSITSVLYNELEDRNTKNVTKKSSKKVLKEDAPITIKEEFKTPLTDNINCSEDGKKILSAFDEEIKMSDYLSLKSGLDSAKFITAMTELEIKGYIKAVPIGRYQININKLK